MIIFLGDSITEWGSWESVLPDFDIVNYGIHGNRTYQVIDRVDELFRKEARQLFLLIGINDLGDNRAITNVVYDYKNLVDLLIQNKVASEINLVSVLPIQPNLRKKLGLTSENVILLNFEIKFIAQENNFTFINIHSKFTNSVGELENSFTIDGLHLSDKGYEVYTNEIIKYLN